MSEVPKYRFDVKRSRSLGSKVSRMWNMDLRQGQRHRCRCGAVCNDAVDLALHAKRSGHRLPKVEPKVIEAAEGVEQP